MLSKSAASATTRPIPPTPTAFRAATGYVASPAKALSFDPWEDVSDARQRRRAERIKTMTTTEQAQSIRAYMEFRAKRENKKHTLTSDFYRRAMKGGSSLSSA